MRIRLSTGTPAQLAEVPDAAGVLILLPDIGGLRPLFDAHCARLATELNMSVCAPEPFPGREHLTLEERLNGGAAELKDDDKMADALAALEHLGASSGGVIGFCMGGMYAMKAAAQPWCERAVSFYGMPRVPEAWRSSGQASPLDLLDGQSARKVLHLQGTSDAFVPVADGEALRDLGAEVVFYEGAEHGFAHDRDRPAHRPDEAADAWRRAYEWLSGDSR